MSPDIQVVMNWIVKNIEAIRCCQDVADHFGVKLETLRWRFAREQGSTILHYIKRVKMNLAKMVLRSEEIPCYEIASRLKLGTPQYAAENI